MSGSDIVLRTGRFLLLWEAFLTFVTVTASGIGLLNIVSGKEAGLFVLIVQALNAATIVFKTGQWNQNPASPVTVNVASHPPEESS
jgi:hypothetical protein